MSEETPVFDRFVSLAKRELQADDVRLLAHGEAAPNAPNVLLTRLGDGRHVVASFATPPKDREALERRLAMLASTFAEALAQPRSERTRARPPVATSLHEELKALGQRARAIDVVVIDAKSPVVWGCASVAAKPRARLDLLLRDVSDRELASRVDDDSAPGAVSLVREEEAAPLQDVRPPAESQPLAAGGHELTGLEDATPDEPDATRRAIFALRNLPALAGLHKGRHFRHVERDNGYLLGLSFSGIYLLLLVFDGPFDELRAERAAHDALPRIERLVLALPPLDPEPPQPMGGVVALRRRRR